MVVRHVDRLDDPLLRALESLLSEALAEPRKRPVWVAVTLSGSTERRPALGG